VGQKIEVQVERQNKQLTLTPQPAANGTIGVQIGTLAKRRPAANAIEPFTQGAKDMVGMSSMLVGALGKLVSGALPLNQVGGLVEVVHMGSKVSQTGFTQLLYFAALISIELAILNILPIPALDGGHLFLLLIEGLRGRPLPRRIEENMHYAGFILLIGLGVLLIFKDVWSIARGGG
jgi:RIP metalloprotease RseP